MFPVSNENIFNTILMVVRCLCYFQVNALDNLGQTSLHRAAHCGHLQTCRLLLSSGCDPSIVSLQGFTALQMGTESVQQLLQGMLSYSRSTVVLCFTCRSQCCQIIVKTSQQKKMFYKRQYQVMFNSLFNYHLLSRSSEMKNLGYSHLE